MIVHAHLRQASTGQRDASQPEHRHVKVEAPTYKPAATKSGTHYPRAGSWPAGRPTANAAPRTQTTTYLPSGRESTGWAFTVDRYGSRIRSIESCELTGTTVVTLEDNTQDQLYVAADQLPMLRNGPGNET